MSSINRITTFEQTASGPSRIGWKIRRAAIATILRGRGIRFENFFQNDNVAIFPALGVVFNRVKKSGNSTVVAFLDELEARQRSSPVLAQHSTQLIKSRRRPHVATVSTILKLGSFATLTTVRNPYHRAISGFLDKVASGTDDYYQDYPSFGDSSIEAFEHFLSKCQSNAFFGNRHFFPQTELLFQAPANFTKIARLESLATDMSLFLNEIGIPNAAAEELHAPHRVEATEQGKIQNSIGKEHYLSPRSVELID